jgi:ditrans,polycis-polyprenyl diphosphate synthase
MRAARDAHEATRHNSDLVLMLANGYSGRRDIARACRALAEDAQRGQLAPEDIDEALIAGRFGTGVVASGGSELSCPDLVVRTGGEQRLSNFLLWQSAYAELLFTDKMWPEFDEDEYLRALVSYQSRDRRFGQRKQC